MESFISEYALEVKNLRKDFGELTAVNNVSFNIRYGEAVGFIGLNGAGKTTTLKTILGLLKPTSGTINIDGKPHSARQSLDNVGALNEQPAFYSHFSGTKNLQVLLQGANKTYSDESLDYDLGRLGIQEHAAKKVRDYSKGMRTRLGIAQVIARNGRIYIFDEPGTGLDPVGINFVRELMRALADAGGAVLFSSHILSEVEAVCDRVAMIHRGHMMAFDTLGNIRRMGIDKERFSVVVPQAKEQKARQVLAKQFGEVLSDDEGNPVASASSGADINAALFNAGIVASAIMPNANALDVVFRELIDEHDRQAAIEDQEHLLLPNAPKHKKESKKDAKKKESKKSKAKDETDAQDTEIDEAAEAAETVEAVETFEPPPEPAEDIKE